MEEILSEQYKKGLKVSQFLETLDVHPVNIAQAVSDENYQKSYEIIQTHPEITKVEFLNILGIEEFRY